MSKKIVLVSGVRTAIGEFMGGLSSVNQIDLGGIVIKEAVNRAKIPTNLIDEVIVGNVGQIADSGFIGRAAMFRAGLPKETTAYSVNRQCGSGLQAIIDGALEILTDNSSVVVACGTENMSRLPYYIKDVRNGYRMGHQQLEDGLIDILTWPLGPFHNGTTAENIANKYNISREDQDKFALSSQQKMIKAQDDKKFVEEIIPVEIKLKKETLTIETDEHPKRDLTLEKLSKLKPAFREGGSVTAGNSSGINDGAAAVVLTTEEKAKELGVKPLMEFVGYAVAGNEAEYMGYGPALSTKKLLKKLNIGIKDLDIVELNEAFASQSIAVIRDLGLDENIVNVNGGAISHGHPVGATGCILTVKMMYEMKKRKSELGLVTMCIGGGQGISAIFKNLQ